VKEISPTLKEDRYTVPEFNKIHHYLSSGEMFDTVLSHIKDAHYIRPASADGI
jgi:hypothetical protein